jgi:S1-C subfamily serine protease
MHPVRHVHAWGRRLEVALVLAFAAMSCALVTPAVHAQARTGRPAAADKLPEAADAERVFGAIVKVSAHAVPNARSAATLGAEREGTGVVIGSDGLILTIGYLVVETEALSIVDSRGRSLSARIVAYDHASGLALLRTLAALDIKPVPFGESAAVAERDRVMIATAGDDTASLAVVASKRPFSGNWEYALDQALYTTPPILNWSGAGLFDRNGKLLGIGSLIVRDAIGGDDHVPGNMFVPIDVLKPILADLVKNGRRAGPARPWLGINADEVQGRLVVARVSPDGPADRAGIRAGDIILGVGGESVRTQPEFYRKVWARGSAGTAIPLKLLQGAEVTEVPVLSMDRVDYFKPPTTY